MNRKALIVFVKNKRGNNVKTRLAASVGHETAGRVYDLLLDSTRAAVREAEADVFVYYSEEVVPDDAWAADGHRQAVQQAGDLGQRMEQAFEALFKQGYDQVAIIGSDCPDLDTEHIEEAFALLNTHDAVIGPSEDGGYYLLGLKKSLPALFRAKKWSTDTVLRDTIQDMVNAGWELARLPVLNDIDTEEDLRHSRFQYLLDTPT